MGAVAFLDPTKLSEFPQQFKLEPCATMTGRLVTPDGKPLGDETLWLGVGKVVQFGQVGNNGKLTSSHGAEISLASGKTDEDGRFEFESVFPGVQYKIQAEGRIVFESELVKPAARIKLGDIMLGREN